VITTDVRTASPVARQRTGGGRHRTPEPRPLWPVLVGLTALSLVLGLVALGRQSLWDDEAFSAAAARLPWGELWALSTTRDPHMLGYHGFLKLWVALGGTAEWWLRLPSVLAGAAAVGLLWAVGHRLAGRRVAGIAAGLLAVCTTLVQYQQEARPYAVAIASTTLALYLLVRAAEAEPAKPTIGAEGAWLWAVYGLVAGLTVYTHPMAVVAAGAPALAALLLPGRVRGVLTGLGIAAVVAAPQVVLMLTTPTPSIWSWVPATDAYHLAGAAYLLSGHTGPVGLVVVAALFALFLVRFRPRFPETLALLWAVALPLAVVAGSALRPLLVSRYLLPALPGVLLCCALVLARWRRPLIGAVLAVLLATSSWSLLQWYTGTDKDDWRAAVATVSAQVRPGDGIITTRDHREPFGYYWTRTANPAALEPVSPARPWGSAIPAAEDRSAIADPAEAIATHDRLWVVLIDPEGLPESLERPLAAAYGEPHREQVTRVTILRYERNP
jgi:mannosyltransferase